MLVLSRRTGESIVIGDNVKITLISIGGNQCRIGIDAPRDIAVHRQEIAEKIKAEKEAAE